MRVEHSDSCFFSICSPICPLKRYFLFSCSRKGILKKGILLVPKSLYLHLLDNSPTSTSVQKNHNRHAILPAEIAYKYKHDSIYEGKLTDLLQPMELYISELQKQQVKSLLKSQDFTVNTTLAIYLIFATDLWLVCVVASSSGQLQAKFFMVLYKRFQYVLAASKVWIIYFIHY